jgi:hypothetical protein
MDPLSAEALNSLAAILTALLPPGPIPALKPLLSVIPVSVSPSGLGGFIGLNDDPQGDLLGRLVRARVLVLVKAGGPDLLDDAVTSVTQSLLAADRTALRQQGVMSLTLNELGPRVFSSPGAADTTAQREVALAALYEYVKVPEAAEGVIKEIPLNLTFSS